MTSYKTLYLDLKKSLEVKPILSDFICPLCDSDLLETSSELYCTNVDCKYDLTIVDLIGKLNLEHKDD